MFNKKIIKKQLARDFDALLLLPCALEKAPANKWLHHTGSLKGLHSFQVAGAVLGRMLIGQIEHRVGQGELVGPGLDGPHAATVDWSCPGLATPSCPSLGGVVKLLRCNTGRL